MRALLSVSDKRGLVDFARELGALGWEIVSTGGTAEALRHAGVPVVPVEQVTGFPEMMDGRVKTLHPKVHGGLLARRHHPGDRAALAQHGITPIDLVAVNLYPFRETVARPGVTLEQAIEQIDIGGPSMLRSAAKNHQDVLVVVDPDDYPVVLDALRSQDVPVELRRALAAKVFAHTAAYDAAIHRYLTRDAPGWPERITLALERRQELRYGENPHQAAALYATEEPGIRDLQQLHGKELSFNNLLDVDAAVLAVAPWSGSDRAACAIIKHTTPCGIALGRSPAEAYTRALATDRTSAFGSVIAFNVALDRATADAMRELFVEVVVAPAFPDDALAALREKKNLRVVRLPPPRLLLKSTAAGTSRGCGAASSCNSARGCSRWWMSPAGGWSPSGDPLTPSGATCGSPGWPWGPSSRTRFSSPGTKRRSASARGRCRGWTPRSWPCTRRASRGTTPSGRC